MDPELAALAEQMVRPSTTDPEQIRANLREMIALLPEPARRPWRQDLDVRRLSIPGPAGNDVPVRIYDVHGERSPRGALVHFHGGAFISGDLDLSERAACRYVHRAGIVVVDVDYRLAPEHPFPAGFEDCYSALAWVAGHAAELRIDLRRIGVGGNSAGGGLAAAVALAARDRGGPALAFQLLLYPVLDDRRTTRSVREFTDTPMWAAHNVEPMWQHYLGPRADTSEVSPYAAPMRALDTGLGLAGLPPTYVLACELDPLRDEDIAYAKALAAAGVPTELSVVAGAYHGFDGLPAAISRRTNDHVVDVLRKALGC